MTKPYKLGPARRAVNMLMAPLVRLGIGGKSTYLLTTTGRKTGQERTTPVTLVENGVDRWLVSPYGDVSWVHNVRALPEVSLLHGNRIERCQAREVGPEDAGPVLQSYVRKVPVTAPFFDAKRGDSVARFVEEAPKTPSSSSLPRPTHPEASSSFSSLMRQSNRWASPTPDCRASGPGPHCWLRTGQPCGGDRFNQMEERTTFGANDLARLAEGRAVIPKAGSARLITVTPRGAASSVGADLVIDAATLLGAWQL